MSREGDRSSFYTYEINKHAASTNDSQRNNATALMETLRLKKENDDLWLCLKLMRDNSELQTANLISSVIAWSDDKFKRRFLELNSALARHHLESRSPFRPIISPTSTPLDIRVSPRDVIGTSPHRSNVGQPRSPSPVYPRNTTAPSPTQISVFDDGGQRSSVQVYSRRTSIVGTSPDRSNAGKPRSRSPSPVYPRTTNAPSPTQGSVYDDGGHRSSVQVYSRRTSIVSTSPDRSNVGIPRSRSPSPVYPRTANAPSPTQGSVYDDGGHRSSVQVYSRRTSIVSTSPDRSNVGIPRSRSPSPVYPRTTNASFPTQGSVYDDGGQRSSVQVYSSRTSMVEVGSRKVPQNSSSPRGSSPFRPLSPSQVSPSINSARNVSQLKNSQSQKFSPTLGSQIEISHLTNIEQDGVSYMSQPMENQMTNPVINNYGNSQSYPLPGKVLPTPPIFNMNEQPTGFYYNERRVSPTAPSRSPRSFDGHDYGGSNERLSPRQFSPDPPASPQPQGSPTNQRTMQYYPEQINSPFYRPISPSQIKRNEQRFSSNMQSHSVEMENNYHSPTGRLSPIIKEVRNSVDHSTYSSGFFQDSAAYSRYPSTLESNALMSPVNSSVRPTPVYEQRDIGTNHMIRSPRFGQSSNHSPYQQSVSQQPMSMRELQFGPSRISPVPDHFSRNNEGRVATPFPGDFVVTDYDTSVRSESAASSVGQPIAFSTPLKGIGHSISPIQELFEEERQMKSVSQARYTRSRSGSSTSSVVRTKTFKPTHRLLGEMAFQLERRILDFIFAKRQEGKKERLHRRFYGYTVSNIPVMITRESTNKHGSIDHAKRGMYQKRYDQIIQSLSAFGYSLEKYSYYCLKMINKYGLLSQPPDRQTMEICGLQNPATLRLYVNDLAQNEKERSHMFVVLECLLLLAHDDGQSVFLW